MRGAQLEAIAGHEIRHADDRTLIVYCDYSTLC